MSNIFYRVLKLDRIASRMFYWVFLLIFLSGFLHLLLYMYIDKNYRIEEAKENIEFALLNQKAILENWAKERAMEIQYLANLPASKELKLEEMAHTFQNYTVDHPDLTSIVYLDKNGFVIIDSAQKNAIINSQITLKERDYFLAAKEGKDYIYDVVVSKATDAPVIIFSSPLVSYDGEFQGLIFGADHLSKVNEMLRQSIHGESGEITLINNDGFILAYLSKRSTKEDENLAFASKLNTKTMKALFNEQDRFSPYVNHQGNKVYGMKMPLNDEKFFIIKEVSEKEILQSHNEMIKVFLYVTIFIIGIGIILFIPLVKHLFKPFLHLKQFINRMKRGDYSTQLDVDSFKNSPIEIQEFMQAFGEMSATIKANNSELQKLSQTDDLTGVANRRYLDIFMENEWVQAKRKNLPLSAIFLDIDFFKEYNDTFGHQAGDACLRNVTTCIRRVIQSKGFVARYGGEEFIIILPNIGKEIATDIAEKIRREVEEQQISHQVNNENRYVTVSLGVATVIPLAELEKEILIELADRALYHAKSSGKNKVFSELN